VARPDVKVVLIKLKGRLTCRIGGRWHFELDVFIPDILLLVIHSMIASVSKKTLAGEGQERQKDNGEFMATMNGKGISHLTTLINWRRMTE